MASKRKNNKYWNNVEKYYGSLSNEQLAMQIEKYCNSERKHDQGKFDEAIRELIDRGVTIKEARECLNS